MTQPKRRRILRWTLIALPVLVPFGIYLASLWVPLEPVELEVGEDTTHITGPLRPDGTVDYVAALDRRARAGVEPGENAAIPLLRALGPDVLPEEPLRSEIYRKLGMEPLPAEGEYFVTLEEFLGCRAASGAPAKGPETDGSSPGSGDRARTAPDDWEAVRDRARRELWRADEQPWLAEWLEANARPLEVVRQGMQRSALYCPRVTAPDTDGIFSMLVLVDRVSNLTGALCIRSMLRLQAGDARASLRDVLAAVRFARHLSRGDTLLVRRLVAVGVLSLALETIRTVIQSGLDGETAPSLHRRLAELGDWPVMTPAMELDMRWTLLSMAQSLYRKSPDTPILDSLDPDLYGDTRDPGHAPGPSQELLDVNRLMRRINAQADRFEEALARPTRLGRLRALASFDRDVQKSLGRWKTRADSWWFRTKATLAPKSLRRRLYTDAVAHLVRGVFLPSMEAALRQDMTAVADLRVVRNAAALLAWRHEHGEYPASLEALVPSYVDAVPVDPLTDEPLVYRRKGDGCVVYSVGPDLTDQDGLEVEDPEDETPHDIVVELE